VTNARRLAIAVLLGALLAFAHYGWVRFQAASIVVPVSGQVLLDGKPLPNAYVKFYPVPPRGVSSLDSNPGSHGLTDSQGKFTLLQIANDRPGALVGEHRIIMRTGRTDIRGLPNAEGYINEQVPYSWRKGLRSYRVSWTGSKPAVFQIVTIDDYSPEARRAARQR
jgi:hypothetical protein